ncbi:MAG: hypothetical protein QM831_31555 [Kofleriaceae bacterium]
MNEKNHPDSPKPNHVLVAVLTTAGTYPAHGFDELPAHQQIKVVLADAAAALKLTSNDTWVAKVGGREVDVTKSYADDHLTGKVEINYGPRETGGGTSAP